MIFNLGGRKGTAHLADTVKEYETTVEQGIILEQGLMAMDQLMNGQIDQSQAIIQQTDSPYEKIASGVLYFIEASMGMETESVKNAIHHLSISEHASNKARDEFVHSGLRTSSFRPGAEYELVHVESSLLSAVCMFLTESYIDAAKALYKLHKTYVALEDLRKHTDSTNVVDWSSPEFESAFPADQLAKFRAIHAQRMQFNAKEAHKNIIPQSSVDEYIISGVQVCSGLLNLILSSIPPNLVKLLSIVGFHGDRQVGLKLLWSTVENYSNIHSCLALIALLLFFDGPSQYSDITLDQAAADEISAKYSTGGDLDTKTTSAMTPADLERTKGRLQDALLRARKQYPQGVLWLLFWGRMVAQTDLAKGVEILSSDECGANQMKQVEGLLVFDKTMMMLSLQMYEEATENFVSLLDLSTWSHGLYKYMAGACQLELYRRYRGVDDDRAAKHKARAHAFFTEAPLAIGKKKFLAKTMPFDKFVIRKCDSMKAVSVEHHLDLVDSVGTSPLLEASYFWGIHTRTPKNLIPRAIESLQYSASERAPLPESRAEKFTRELLLSSYMRLDGQLDEGYKILSGLVPLVITPANPKIGEKVRYHKQKEPWAGPVTLYECAIYQWQRTGQAGAKETRKWLKLLADWDEDYELSTRVNMKVTSATDRLHIYHL